MVLSAFSTEIFWSAIMAVPAGNGMPRVLAVPLLTNRAISISKGTALGIAVSLPEAGFSDDTDAKRVCRDLAAS